MEYTVKPGDTLFGVAKQFDISPDAIKLENNLKSNTLTPGQKLKINNQTNLIHIVKKGDNLYDLANEYNTTVDDIKTLNNLKTNELELNQKLLIPVKTYLECYGEDLEENITYTVKQGDNLYDIAASFNTTVSSIKDLNNLKNNSLEIGQKLIIKEN